MLFSVTKEVIIAAAACSAAAGKPLLESIKMMLSKPHNGSCHVEVMGTNKMKWKEIGSQWINVC